MVRDVRILDKVIGLTRNCQLSATGIVFDGERFHDPIVTTQLMSDIARLGKARQQRNGVTSSKTVWVMVTANPGNADHVHVRNPKTGEQVMLPNWDQGYSKGTPWHLLKKIRQFAKARNLAFHSPDERSAARVAFMEAMGRVLPGLKFAEQRKRSAILDPRPDLVPGNAVTIHELREGEIVLHDLADEAADTDRKSTKSVRRGGEKATQKGVETRKRKKSEAAKTAAETAPPSKAPVAPPPSKAMEHVDDVAERLKRIMERMDKEGDDAGT